eukprot:748130-Hanusia_phi.AAC.1
MSGGAEKVHKRSKEDQRRKRSGRGERRPPGRDGGGWERRSRGEAEERRKGDRKWRETARKGSLRQQPLYPRASVIAWAGLRSSGPDAPSPPAASASAKRQEEGRQGRSASPTGERQEFSPGKTEASGADAARGSGGSSQRAGARRRHRADLQHLQALVLDIYLRER